MEIKSILNIGEKTLTHVARKAYIKPTCEIRTLESLGLKMEPLVNDTLQSPNRAELLNLARKFLGRNFTLAELNKVLDVEHCLPHASWNGTVNAVNESIRQGYVTNEIKGIIKKLDEIMASANRTQFDTKAYRMEEYNINSRHLQDILKLKPGDLFKDNAYRYITGDIEYAKNFAGRRAVSVRYNYILPKGSKCIGTGENSCALVAKDSISEILSVDKSNPTNIIINAILRTQ